MRWLVCSGLFIQCRFLIWSISRIWRDQCHLLHLKLLQHSDWSLEGFSLEVAGRFEMLKVHSRHVLMWILTWTLYDWHFYPFLAIFRLLSFCCWKLMKSLFCWYRTALTSNREVHCCKCIMWPCHLAIFGYKCHRIASGCALSMWLLPYEPITTCCNIISYIYILLPLKLTYNFVSGIILLILSS